MKYLLYFLLITATITSVHAAEYRFNCNDNPNVSCGPLNATTSMNTALTIALDANAQLYDSIVIFKSQWNGSNYVEKWREYMVANSPVTSSSDLYDFGYMVDVTDFAPPNPGIAALDGPGVSGWITGCVGILYVAWCKM